MTFSIKLKQPWYKYIIFFWDWTLFEKSLLGLNTCLVTAIFIWQMIMPQGIRWYIILIAYIAALTNITCNILIAKKKISNYFWAFVAVATTGGVAFYNHLSGLWILNWIFLSLANVWGLILWLRSSKDKTNVKSRKMPYWLDAILIAIVVGVVAGLSYVFMLKDFQNFWYGSTNSYQFTFQYILDASILVLSLSAMILTVFRLREQWILWLIVNIICVALYISLATSDITSIQMIIMYVGLEVNAIYGLVCWFKEKKPNLQG
jgi:nicotinamide mononucleotide transporter